MEHVLINGDCLEEMKNIPDQSVDMVLTDPPYGTTACKWDVIIPFDKMWSELRRIIKTSGTIAIFGTEPFSSSLRVSNLPMFKYDWTVKKNRVTGHLNCKKMPMLDYEIVSIFQNKTFYYPQFSEKPKDKIRTHQSHVDRNSDCYGKMGLSQRSIPINMRYPSRLSCPNLQKIYKPFHPNEKSVNVLEYLIKTYTIEGETVLDFTMGSGSTGVACKNLNRKFIGIEKDDGYFKIAQERILNG